jgi:hypothetical protein
MILDPSSAARFIDGYKRILLQIGQRHRNSDNRSLVQRLVDARAEVLKEPSLIDAAVAALDAQSQSVAPDVAQAARTLDVRNWVYLRDTTRHSIFIDPSGDCAFGVVGLTDRISALVHGAGVYLEAGIVSYRGRFVCDGLVVRSAWLGPNYRREFNDMLRTLKANHRFYQ